MRRILICTVLAALLAVPVAASTVSPGPFVGTVEQDETNEHTYDNQPDGTACISVVRWYTVRLDHSPADGVLTLRAGDQEVPSVGGQAVLHLQRGYCTVFDIEVEGTQVQGEAAYTVVVCRSATWLAPSPVCGLPGPA